MYMLTSDMNLKIRLGTAGYNNESLVSDSEFSLGRNDMVNTSAPSHITLIIPKHAHRNIHRSCPHHSHHA